MSDFPFLAQRLFNTPVLVHPRRGELIVAALAQRLGIDMLERQGGTLVPMMWDDDDDDELADANATPDQGYDLIGDCAVIAVRGTLVQRCGSLRPYSGMTGYNGLRQVFLTALADPAVGRIAFDICSGGGEVHGCFDLVDTIFAARGTKPLAAILNEYAYSAAYAIASAVDPGCIYVPRTGGTGSIGVVVAHSDLSGAADKAGLKVTFITNEGAERKIDGNQWQPLSDEAFADIKAKVDATAAIFHETVARNRGLTVAAVRAMRAATYQGADGVDVGLADACIAPDAAFAAFLAA